jgi:hypothetical protein
MNGMPFEMQLTQPLAETFHAAGVAPNVLAAHNMAWDALTSSLGDDPVEAWKLGEITHAYSTEPPGVAFTATFLRNPEYTNDEEGEA